MGWSGHSRCARARDFTTEAPSLVPRSPPVSSASSPPTTNPCYYGIDTPTREELIASSHEVGEIREYLGADSLAYLSLAGLYAFTGGRSESFCDACFTGRYPVPLEDEVRSRQLHLFEARER